MDLETGLYPLFHNLVILFALCTFVSLQGSSRLKCTIASFRKRILLNPNPTEVETEAKCWSIKASARLFGEGRGSECPGSLSQHPRQSKSICVCVSVSAPVCVVMVNIHICSVCAMC